VSQNQPKSLLNKHKLAIALAKLSHARKEQASEDFIHLSIAQRSLVILFSGYGAIIHPKRADLVANSSELLDGVVLDFLLFIMKAHPQGKELLFKRPQITQATLNEAWSCGKHTFGDAYAQFMGTRAFSPQERPLVRFIANPDLAYVAARLRESHDFWHVLFGCSTSVLSELKLKQIEFYYTSFPSAGLSYVLAPIRLSLKNRSLLSVHFRSRKQVAGARNDLLFLFIENRLHVPLISLRKKLMVKAYN